LKPNQEFEIELYNPHQKSVLAKIYLNGISIADGGLVLRPAERVFLERYLDDNRKFKFGTYEVENSKEALQAIAKNGDLKVEFYYEQEPQGWYGNGTITINQPYPYQSPYNGTGQSPFNIDPWVGGVTNTGGYGGTLTTNGNNLFASNSSAKVGLDFSDGYACCDSMNVSYSATPSIETGRVEKGAISSQALVTVNENFNSWVSETETLKILPFSQKPHEISEIRNYCSNCSSRIKKSSWKFCPYCQNPLND
jgi:hypothetical protein